MSEPNLTPTVMYVVVAYRWGNRENHSYIVGVYTTETQAIQVSELETSHRGGKYSVSIEKCQINSYDQESYNYSETIYSTIIPYNQPNKN